MNPHPLSPESDRWQWWFACPPLDYSVIIADESVDCRLPDPLDKLAQKDVLV